jgi:putative ABC transport system ATP-binding protein
MDLNRDARTTLVLVTHDPALAGRARRVIRLAAGRIASDGPPERTRWSEPRPASDPAG